MIKLLDFRREDPSSALLYADTKAEVPASAEGFEGLIEGDLTQFFDTIPGAGTLIITSAFETAFVRSDGLIQWKGDPDPTPPPTPVTVTLNCAAGGKLVAQYISPSDGSIAETECDSEIVTFEAISGSTITVFSGLSASGGDISTTAEKILVIDNGYGALTYLVTITEATTISYIEPF